ncbi:hypothetical protein J6590_053216 [Homalodisca vitripennis]|nr:hypothetical protein J6590_053216 [Homalodisca vitripennis]
MFAKILPAGRLADPARRESLWKTVAGLPSTHWKTLALKSRATQIRKSGSNVRRGRPAIKTTVSLQRKEYSKNAKVWFSTATNTLGINFILGTCIIFLAQVVFATQRGVHILLSAEVMSQVEVMLPRLLWCAAQSAV